MQASPLRVALVQHSFIGDVDTNCRLTEADVLQRAEAGVRLVILLEPHNSLYFCQREEVAGNRRSQCGNEK